MVKINFTNNQTAFEYALYMIAASYFDKAVCKSKFIERKMLVQYKEQKLSSQYRMEDICIDFMEGFVKSVSSDFFHQDMDVYLAKKSINAPFEIVFKNNRYCISFIAKYSGNKSKIDVKLRTAA